MTRTSTKWVTMAIVMIMAAGAWAQPKRYTRHDKPDQERREYREREERSAHREMGKEREEREHHERREREEREHRERREHEEGPELRVLRFEHIPAQAYMQVLMQLSKKEFVKDAISDAAIALCEHSNTIVIIAPPRALECFEKLAHGVDQPNEFMKNMPPQRGPGMCPCPKAGRRPGTPQCGKCPNAGQCKCPKAGRRPGTPQCGKCPNAGQCKCPKAAQRPPAPGMRQCPKSGKCAGRPDMKPAGPPHDLMSKLLTNPTSTMFGRLLSSEKLRLDRGQKAAIINLARQSQQRVDQMRQRVMNAIKGMNPKDREANARKMVGNAREALNHMNGQVRKSVFGILKPEQHKLATLILNAPKTSGPKPTGCRCGGKCPKCRARAKSPKPATPKCNRKPSPAPRPAPPAPGRGCGGGGCKMRK
ncbi:MAG: hypothetical protein HN350_04215 [Phycisphaerales bacterium]|nr:hypothetical protein [Phycisphaerales bacterium]